MHGHAASFVCLWHHCLAKSQRARCAQVAAQHAARRLVPKSPPSTRPKLGQQSSAHCGLKELLIGAVGGRVKRHGFELKPCSLWCNCISFLSEPGAICALDGPLPSVASTLLSPALVIKFENIQARKSHGKSGHIPEHGFDHLRARRLVAGKVEVQRACIRALTAENMVAQSEKECVDGTRPYWHPSHQHGGWIHFDNLSDDKMTFSSCPISPGGCGVDADAQPRPKLGPGH